MHEESLGIDVPGKGILTKGETYKLRAHIVADSSDTKHRPLLFHDRHSDETDEVIDMTTIRGARADNYAWGRWKPSEIGAYDLWTVMLDNASRMQRR